jgi:hypothetical protein
MTKREKLATLFGLMAEGFPAPGALREETRELIGLPRNLPGGGYSKYDTQAGVVETLAAILAGEEDE